jgi:hypothetical protein
MQAKVGDPLAGATRVHSRNFMSSALDPQRRTAVLLISADRRFVQAKSTNRIEKHRVLLWGAGQIRNTTAVTMSCSSFVAWLKEDRFRPSGLLS